MDRNLTETFGNTKRDRFGYVQIYRKGLGYRKRARIIMERKLNRKLERFEVVHHKNGIKHDDREENLELTDKSKHASHHGKLRKGKKYVGKMTNNTKTALKLLSRR